MSGQLVSRSHSNQQRVHLPPAASEHLQVYHVVLVSKLPTSTWIPPSSPARPAAPALLNNKSFWPYKAGFCSSANYSICCNLATSEGHVSVVNCFSLCCCTAKGLPNTLPNTLIYTHNILVALSYIYYLHLPSQSAAGFQSVLTGFFFQKCVEVRGLRIVMSFPGAFLIPLNISTVLFCFSTRLPPHNSASWPRDYLCRVRVNHFIVTHGWSVSPKGFFLASHVPPRHMKGEEERFGRFEAWWSWSCLHCLHLMFFFLPTILSWDSFFPPMIYLLKSCLDVPYCKCCLKCKAGSFSPWWPFQDFSGGQYLSV